MSSAPDHSDFLGPHEQRELELMASGAKPLAMFSQQWPSEECFFDEGELDALVAQGRLVKQVRIDSVDTPDGSKGQVRRVFYAQAVEAWRISAMLFVQDLYDSLGPGLRLDLERVIGLLLGYERDHVEAYIARLTKQRSTNP
jgi:hypothetical protein